MLLAFAAPVYAQQASAVLEQEGTPRFESGVSWREALRVERTSACERAPTEGEPASCKRHSVYLSNNSDRRIKCTAVLEPKTHCGPGPLPPPLAPSNCAFEATLQSPDDYYPAGALRRLESGEAVIEFTVTAGRAWARDVVVVSSTGFRDLDLAADKIGRQLRIATECKEARVRRKVLFEMISDPPERHAHLGQLIGTVLVTDYVEPGERVRNR